MSASWSGGSTRAWRRLRAFVLERDGYRCRFPSDDVPGRDCLAWATHVDHVIPRSAGGLDTAANTRAACARHNLAAGSKARTDPKPKTRRRPVRWSW